MSLVIPARNEAANLLHVLSCIPPCVTEVILVDGFSTDGTVALARQLLPTIRIVQQLRKGKGAALRAGFAACTGDIIVMIDADGSMHPGEVEIIVAALCQGQRFAKGSRFISSGGSSDISVTRFLGNRALNMLVNRLFGTHFTDLCYGFMAFWRDCLEDVEIDCDGFEVETQLTLRAIKAGMKIVEVPSYEYPRMHGQSHLQTWRDGWRVLHTIIQEWPPLNKAAEMTQRRGSAAGAPRPPTESVKTAKAAKSFSLGRPERSGVI